MPKKYEHVVMCRLSKRQRFLYDDFMSQAKYVVYLVSNADLSHRPSVVYLGSVQIHVTGQIYGPSWQYADLCHRPVIRVAGFSNYCSSENCVVSRNHNCFAINSIHVN